MGCSEQPQEMAMPAISYKGNEIYQVRFEKPVQRPDLIGNMKSWQQGYMVKLKMTLPPAPSPVFNVYLGDELIPEHGGWQEGIYFWVYDGAKLQTLQGRTISYQMDRGKRVEVGTFNLDRQKIKTIDQTELRVR